MKILKNILKILSAIIFASITISFLNFSVPSEKFKNTKYILDKIDFLNKLILTTPVNLSPEFQKEQSTDVVVPENKFYIKIKKISEKLNIRASWLIAVMRFETAGTFSTSIKNKKSGATGLIQFMPSTAQGLGTSTAELSKMTKVRQLDFVYKHLSQRRFRNKLKSFLDVYLAVLYPASVGKPDNYVIGKKGAVRDTITSSNKGFDLNKDGKITVGEIKNLLYKRMPQLAEKKKFKYANILKEMTLTLLSMRGAVFYKIIQYMTAIYSPFA